jgi:anti-anti-sigma factor
MDFRFERDAAFITLPEFLQQGDLQEFNRLVQDAIKKGAKMLFLDCGLVNLIDSMLTGAMIKALKNTRDNDCSMVLTNVSPQNQETLEQASLDKILTVRKGDAVAEPESELGVTMKAEVRQNVVVILFSGMMNGLHDASELKTMVQNYLPDHGNYIFDFAEAIYIDSLGVGEIVHVHRKIKQADGKLAFCGANEILRDLLKGLGLLQVIPYFRDQEEALRHFA